MKNSPAMQGSASVLIILVMLSLTAFGVLSLVSAYSDLKLARKSADFVEQYYKLDTLGIELLKDTRALSLQDGHYEKLGWQKNDEVISKTISSGGLNLTIELSLDKNTMLSVLKWQEWQEPFEYEEGLDVWPGE